MTQIAGQLTASATAQPLSSDQKIASSLLIRAKSDNGVVIHVGDADVTTSNGFILEPGDALVLESINNLNTLYAVTPSSTAVLSWIVLNP